MDLDNIPLIPIVVVKQDPVGVSFHSYLAYVLTNPSLRASGTSEEEAIKRLKIHIISGFISNRVSVKMMNITLDDLLIEEVHRS